MRAAVALLVLVASAGCLGASTPAEAPACPVPPARTIPMQGSSFGLASDPEEMFDTLVYFPEGGWPYFDSYEVPTDEFFSYKVLAEGGNDTLARVRMDAAILLGGQTESHDSSLAITYSDPGFVEGLCRIVDVGRLSWPVEEPVRGEEPAPGRGALVHAAGFWENGTLFWTNIAQIHESDWPRAGWYEWEGDDALPVYVYDSTRDERSALWYPPPDPVTGTQPWAYYTTIKGFNQGLKSTSTMSARVVRMEPDWAYTQDGNEAHPLYGDALIFYILVDDVVSVPCPAAVPDPSACDVPAAPVLLAPLLG